MRLRYPPGILSVKVAAQALRACPRGLHCGAPDTRPRTRSAYEGGTQIDVRQA
jgi:hypothetical protein